MGEDMAFVLEDDAHLAPDFERRWRQLRAQLRKDQGWDVVFLGCVRVTMCVLVFSWNALHQVLGLPQSVQRPLGISRQSIYIYIYIFFYQHMYIHTYIQTDRHTHAHTDMQILACMF